MYTTSALPAFHVEYETERLRPKLRPEAAAPALHLTQRMRAKITASLSPWGSPKESVEKPKDKREKQGYSIKLRPKTSTATRNIKHSTILARCT